MVLERALLSASDAWPKVSSEFDPSLTLISEGVEFRVELGPRIGDGRPLARQDAIDIDVNAVDDHDGG